MAQPSKRIRPKEDEVNTIKRIVANKTKKKYQSKKNTTGIAVIKTPSQSKGQSAYNKMLSDAKKSGFIKINQKAILNEVTGKLTNTKYTVTAKGNKYLKDTSNAYAKDPMKLRPKPKPMTKRKMGA
jgi:hypothetical protein